MKNRKTISGDVVHKECIEKIGPKIAEGLKRRLKNSSIEDLGIDKSRLNVLLSGQGVLSVNEAKTLAKKLNCTPEELILGE